MKTKTLKFTDLGYLCLNCARIHLKDGIKKLKEHIEEKHSIPDIE